MKTHGSVQGLLGSKLINGRKDTYVDPLDEPGAHCRTKKEVQRQTRASQQLEQNMSPARLELATLGLLPVYYETYALPTAPRRLQASAWSLMGIEISVTR